MWPVVKFDPTPLIRPSVHGPLVTVLTGFHCKKISFQGHSPFLLFLCSNRYCHHLFHERILHWSEMQWSSSPSTIVSIKATVISFRVQCYDCYCSVLVRLCNIRWPSAARVATVRCGASRQTTWRVESFWANVIGCFIWSGVSWKKWVSGLIGV